MTSNTKIILGLLAAAAAGAAAGILLAPEKGSDLRKKIRESIDGVMDDVAELLAIGQDEIKERFADLREDAKQAKEAATESYNSMHGHN